MSNNSSPHDPMTTPNGSLTVGAVGHDATLDANFLLSVPDQQSDTDGASPHTVLAATTSDVTMTTDRQVSSNSDDGGSASPSFTLLDTSSDPQDPAPDFVEASTAEVGPGAGNINVIGTPLQDANAGHADVGLHIALPVDSGFAATVDLSFGPATAAPSPSVWPTWLRRPSQDKACKPSSAR
jgi:hypothetical protein